jgi:RimJ/RimL family protein N-acetyltransferase
VVRSVDAPPALGTFEAELRDGRRVRVRPITPADKRGLSAGLARMSPRSRYLRFHRVIERLSDAELRYLTEIDMRTHFAWVAVSLAEPGEPGVAVIRYVRDAVDPRSAEVAVTVIDDYQGVGLGTLLLETLLVSAMLNGIERVVALVLPENEAALRLFGRVGARPGLSDDGLLVIDVPVSAPGRTRRASTPHLAGASGLRVSWT